METMNTELLRTPDELSELFQLAKLNELDFSNVTQILYSEKENDYSNIKLIELDKNLLNAIEVGDSLSFRGEKSESVVLCTKNQTYDVRDAETSNSLILVPNLKFHSKLNGSEPENKSIVAQEVKGIFHSYLEVRQCKPRFSKLPVILGPTTFNGTEYEKRIDKKELYNWNKLRSHIQASDEELINALSQYSVVNINGYYRIVSFEYETQALTNMLEFVDYNSIEPDQVDKEASLEALHELIPEPVFNAIFDKYTEPSGKFKDTGEILYRYIEEKVCRLLANVLLTASPVTEYTGFMEAWSIGTPEGMKSQEKYLYGIAIIKWNSEKNRKEVVSFPESNLPDNIEKRFEELFKIKDKWTIEEITPYIINLATEKLNVNALLTKYGRMSTKNGIRFYSSKHGK
ncbi:sister chromatid cohesion protein DCC1 [Leptopilina boulardi]|uniref:sister chromatid cohesion protein DCC1 n=1 Tax=Leptopilina boulardi TaxID=63433 RepID=UPI0021F536DE|nr:sister chromatid cohesion protein DCC1 [Leptopilina boulardi]XP_051161357.1 sister chromatid cohesion protein DCC1 [Leptopilina boulardi]